MASPDRLDQANRRNDTGARLTKALLPEGGMSAAGSRHAKIGKTGRTTGTGDTGRHLKAKVVPIDGLATLDVAQMFELYDTYYGGTSLADFERDLKVKDLVFTLSEQGTIRGFSTLMRFAQPLGGEMANFLYSGDTIIDHRFWGRNDFALTWIRHAGRVKASAPDRPLYWFLTVKGHRTYRYLSVFSRRYYPACGWGTPKDVKAQIDSLGRQQYGASYDPQRGVVHFPRSRGHLKTPWAVVPERDKGRPEVRFFLERNPGYVFGDEMVCLCLLSEENLKPIALRAFLSGMADAAQSDPMLP